MDRTLDSVYDDFFPNDDADTHCLQACYQSVVAALRHERLDMSTVEAETGYEDGRLTWQFAMILSLADKHQLNVVDYECFDPHAFAADPVAAIREQIHDEAAVQHQIAFSNLTAEQQRAQACIDRPRITFRNGVPGLEDVRSEIRRGARVICLVNGAVLDGADGYRPHFVVIRNLDDETIQFHDPGPPGTAAREVSLADFNTAWTDPSPSVANYVAVSVEPVDGASL